MIRRRKRHMINSVMQVWMVPILAAVPEALAVLRISEISLVPFSAEALAAVEIVVQAMDRVRGMTASCRCASSSWMLFSEKRKQLRLRLMSSVMSVWEAVRRASPILNRVRIVMVPVR